jgi:hypothetical protein
MDWAYTPQKSRGIWGRIVRVLEHPRTRRRLARWLWLCQFSEYDLRNPPQIVWRTRKAESKHSGVDMTALDRQIAGNHYKTMMIQPLEYALANNLGICEHAVVKYVSRWRDKGGVDDLRKAAHYIEILIERETAPEGTPKKPSW